MEGAAGLALDPALLQGTAVGANMVIQHGDLGSVMQPGGMDLGGAQQAQVGIAGGAVGPRGGLQVDGSKGKGRKARGVGGGSGGRSKDGAKDGAHGDGGFGLSKPYLQQTLHTQQDTQRKLEVRENTSRARVFSARQNSALVRYSCVT